VLFAPHINALFRAIFAAIFSRGIS
jgi:hypothetical protein